MFGDIIIDGLCCIWNNCSQFYWKVFISRSLKVSSYFNNSFLGFSSLRRVFTVFITSSFGSLLPDCTHCNEVDLPGFLGWWNSSYLLSTHDIGGGFLSQVASVYRGLEVSLASLYLKKKIFMLWLWALNCDFKETIGRFARRKKNFLHLHF